MIDKQLGQYIGELSQETILQLAAVCDGMVSSVAWAEYLRLLEGAQHSARATGFSDDPARFLYWQGFVNGIAYGPEIMKEIVAASARLAQKEEAKGSLARRLPVSDDGDMTF